MNFYLQDLFSQFWYQWFSDGSSFPLRLFSCGTGKEGDSFLVEWNESEGAIRRTYNGFRKKSAGVVQFDTTQNHFLAVGEDSQIKFWDMDNINILASTDADGGLPVSLTMMSYIFYQLTTSPVKLIPYSKLKRGGST